MSMLRHGNQLALVALIATIAVSANAQVVPMGPPVIATSGQGEGKATPDRASVVVSVQTRAATAAAAASDNAVKTKGVLDALARLGLTRDQLSTEGYTVYPDMKYDNAGNAPKVVGYVVTNRVRAETKRTDQAGSIVDAALGAGANMISGLSFYASNIDDARRTAITSAVASARADADAMARAAGGTLGSLIELSTNGPTVPPRPIFDMAMAKSSLASTTPLNPGDQTVTVYIYAKWQFVK